MTVFFDQPVSPRRAAVSSVMVRGEASQSLFMSFHSPSDRCTFMAVSSLQPSPVSKRYTVVYFLMGP